MRCITDDRGALNLHFGPTTFTDAKYASVFKKAVRVHRAAVTQQMVNRNKDMPEQPKERKRKLLHVPHTRKDPSPRPRPHDNKGGDHKRRAIDQRPVRLACFFVDRGRGRPS